MKIRLFRYLKEAKEEKDYELMVIKEYDTALEGISMHDMTKADKEKVLAVQKQYEEALEPYMKYYRKFLKNKIIKTYN